MKLSMMRIIILLISLAAKFQDCQCSSVGSVVEIDESTKRSIVDTHNAIRGQISNAANMRKLTWDEELAQHCRNVASHCFLSTEEQKTYFSFTGDSGENIIWDPDSVNVTEDTVEVGVQEWYDQKDECKADESGYFHHPSCVQYVRLVWAENDKIGCSAAACPYINIGINAVIDGLVFCCAYGPAEVANTSQYEDPENIFLPGESCNKCDENYGCEKKLCVPCDESPSACVTTALVTTSPQQDADESHTTSASPSTTSGSHRLVSSSMIYSAVLSALIFNYLKIAKQL